MFALYRRLLGLYPFAFRDRFEVELLQAVGDRRRFESRVRWPSVFGDLIATAAVERWKGRQGMRTKLAVLGFIVVGVFGATFLLTGAIVALSSLYVAAAALAGIALLYAIASLIGRRGPVGAERNYAGGRRARWWWIPAGIAGAFQVIFFIVILAGDPKKENVFGLSVMIAFSALIFGGMTVRNRVTGNWMIATGVLPMLPFFWVIVPTIVALLVIVMALSDNVRMSGRPRAAV